MIVILKPLLCLKCIRRFKYNNANFLLRVSFTVTRGKIFCLRVTVAFNYLVHYSPWRNKIANVSLKNQACMQNCYNKQFYYVLNV